MTKWKTVRPEADEKNTKKVEKKRGSAKRKLRVILPLLVVAALAIGAVVWALPNLPLKPQMQNAASYRGVVELWNVESFEGGVGSREAWIKGRAAKFEKLNTGLFVHVTTLTEGQLSQKLEQGDNFDIICFSRGVGSIIKDKLAPTEVNVGAVRNNFLLSGQLNGVQYAVPLYTGAYCLFARAAMLPQTQLLDNALSATFTRKVGKNNVTLQPLICGFTPYNSPLSALAMSGGRGNVNVSDEITQYQAYERFLDNRTAVTLLGTQRDLYRLSQRETNGRIESLAFAPLGGYTDLVQYLGVSAQTTAAQECRAFLEYLLAEQSQQTLVNVCMFSVLEQTFYTADRYAECEAQLTRAYVPNVFGDGDAIVRQRQMAIDTLAV